jgi:hypothetical protein
LSIARSGLRFDISGTVWSESRSPAVRIIGSLPLLPANSVAHDRFFTALDEEFTDCDAVSMPSVPTDSFLWNYVHESTELKKQFLSYVMHGVRMCHVIPVPSTSEDYLGNIRGKRRYNMKRQARILREHFGGRLELVCFTNPDQIGELCKLVTPTGQFAGLRRWGEADALTIDRHEAESLAARGLLLVYLLLGAGRACAAVTGLKYQNAYHVDAIPRDRALDRLSPGSTIVHLAILDVIRNTSIQRIDMGFGSPTYPFSSTNVLEPRGSLLLFRKTLANRIRRFTHSTFESVVDLAKGRMRTLGPPAGSRV